MEFHKGQYLDKLFSSTADIFFYADTQIYVNQLDRTNGLVKLV